MLKITAKRKGSKKALIAGVAIGIVGAVATWYYVQNKKIEEPYEDEDDFEDESFEDEAEKFTEDEAAKSTEEELEPGTAHCAAE